MCTSQLIQANRSVHVQVQLSQMQQATLAAQVAQMRANAKANPSAAVAPGRIEHL